jgi:hypothetical protein
VFGDHEPSETVQLAWNTKLPVERLEQGMPRLVKASRSQRQAPLR